jgi:ethanolamine ammonia-lyase large subunit
MAAQMALAEVPLARSLEEALVPYEKDEVTRLIFGSHDRDAFIQISHMTVGDYGIAWLTLESLGL